MRPRRSMSRLAAGREAARESRAGVRGLNAHTTNPASKTMAPWLASGPMARKPVFLLKETIWRMSSRGRSSRSPVRLMPGPSYTAARISSAIRPSGTLASTTPASTAALGMP